MLERPVIKFLYIFIFLSFSLSALSQSIEEPQTACLEGSLAKGKLMHFGHSGCTPIKRLSASPAECEVLARFILRMSDLVPEEQVNLWKDNYNKFCPSRVSQVIDDASASNTVVQ